MDSPTSLRSVSLVSILTLASIINTDLLAGTAQDVKIKTVQPAQKLLGAE